MKALQILVLTLVTFFVLNSYSQCPGCMPDFGCVSTLPGGGICDSLLMDGNVGSAYQDDVSFYMPKMINSPLGTATLNEIQITGITGLPFGITWECDASSAQCKYFPQTMPLGQEVGCIRFCGTPLDNPGIYTIRASIKAKATQGSISVIQDTAYYTQMLLLPGSSGNASFSWSPGFGCDADSFQFNALLNGAPNFTTWQWDFGNGNTSTLENPPKQAYGLGSHIVTCKTDIYEYAISNVELVDVSNDYCGDIEEPFCNCGTPIIGTCPEPYFTISDGGGASIFASTALGGTTSGMWPGLNISLNNPSYVLTLFDEDNGPPLGSQDDTLGIMSFNPLATGIINITAPGSGGTTTELNLTIIQQIAYSVIDTDTVHVYPTPMPIVTNTSSIDSICTGDSVQLTVGTASAYQWNRNSAAITGANNQSYWAKVAGTYTIDVLSSNGCTGTSNNNVVITELALPPQPMFSFNPSNNLLTAANNNGYSIQWLLNGTPISGATDTFLIAITSGNYSLVYANALGCTTASNLQQVMVNPTNIAQLNANKLVIYPNPNNGNFKIENAELDEIRVYDITGKLVYEKSVSKHSIYKVQMSEFSAGMYLLVVKNTSGEMFSSKFIIEN